MNASFLNAFSATQSFAELRGKGRRADGPFPVRIRHRQTEPKVPRVKLPGPVAPLSSAVALPTSPQT